MTLTWLPEPYGSAERLEDSSRSYPARPQPLMHLPGGWKFVRDRAMAVPFLPTLSRAALPA